MVIDFVAPNIVDSEVEIEIGDEDVGYVVIFLEKCDYYVCSRNRFELERS